jgi:hypothetical protein
MREKEASSPEREPDAIAWCRRHKGCAGDGGGRRSSTRSKKKCARPSAKEEVTIFALWAFLSLLPPPGIGLWHRPRRTEGKATVPGFFEKGKREEGEWREKEERGQERHRGMSRCL